MGTYKGIAFVSVTTLLLIILLNRTFKIASQAYRTLSDVEEALRNEKVFADTMIESMPGIIYFYDSEGSFLRWNKNFETVSGYTDSEISRLQPRDFFQGEDILRVEERIKEVFSQGESSLEARFVNKQGTATPYFFTGRRVLYKGKQCLVGMGIDISDRILAEAQLVRSEQKYRELVEQANSIILRWDRSGRILFMNRFGCEFFGYSHDEIVGQNVMETIVPSTESNGRDLSLLIEEICNSPETHDHLINENIRRNGERVLIDWTNRVQQNGHEKETVILSVGTDITHRKRIEMERQRREQAEAADHVKSAFLATMSHELRTPLNSIIGFTGIIIQEMAGPLNQEQKKQLAMVQDSARHLLELVNDVLDISKIEAGQLEVCQEYFDIRQSIKNVLRIMRPQIDSQNLTLKTDLSPELNQLKSDRRRFEQILLNLLSNAVKYTEQGGIELEAVIVNDKNSSQTEPAKEFLQIKVSDTGIGVKQEDLEEVFEPFRQIDSGISRKHDGTGLGLAICRRLAELMGGTIDMESQWGYGSTLIVKLPLTPVEKI
ncbi:PAS domain-containing hybrid sensor histidine kinase/response regulator [Rubinisphaera sp.]|uniref:PAS domain-containing sensor histidine kinase n=1 Tax=Rubinisphaera sp. TaxID=2024857 RepID=UPI0025D76AA8|nr:PAS domain-containing hybrid sensor histidine kinase/response regulator [Rubinisphaera sp.]